MFDEIRLAAPWALGLLLVMPLLAMWWRKRTVAVGLRYASVDLVAQGDVSWRVQVRRPLLVGLRWLALTLIIVALARPQLVDAQQTVRGEGVDIALAVDISGSMAALDFEPQNRLEAAKAVIEAFVAERPFDRIGLVVFASEAFSQAPPTTDHVVLARLLAQVQLATDLEIDSGTAIGLGLANAANMLKESTAKSKVVILLTDGVNNSGQIDPLTAAEAAKTLGIKVYTIGMGKPGQVPIPVPSPFGGERVVWQDSELDEETLQAIADSTNALYFRAENATGLRQIYDEINTLERSEIEIQTFTRYEELASWFLLPALIIILLEMFLRETIFRVLP